MSGGAINSYTSNYRFKLINFAYPRWHTEEWSNWQVLDATLKSLGALASQGIWANNTSYNLGDRVIDETTGSIYQAAIANTSSSSGTFSAERTAHPTYWTLVTAIPNYRGVWTTGATYSIGDIVSINSNKWYYCILSHTASALFSSDTAKWTIIIDFSTINNLYYGARTVETNLRPDGTASQAGDIYFNSTSVLLRLFNGATWQNYNSASAAASGVTFTPTGNIAATNVQAALAEVDSEKADAAATTAALAGKAATVHTHAISDVTNLTTSLADKASLSTSGTFAQVMAFTNGLTVGDANFSLTLAAGVPTFTLEAGKALTYDRTTDTMTSPVDWLFTTTGRIRLPVGTVAQRLTAAAGDIRYNSDSGYPEFTNGTDWLGLNPVSGFRNRLINGCFRLNQRGGTTTVATTDDAYVFDRWYLLSQTGNCSYSRVSLPENGSYNAGRINQDQAVAQRMGVAQIIEGRDCIDLRGSKITLSGRARISAATTIRYAILEWTGTEDAVTSDIINTWTSTTYTPGNFFIATTNNVLAVGSLALSANTWTQLTDLVGTVGASANNIIVVFWTDTAVAQNVTFDLARCQLEAGAARTPFERRPFAVELQLCQRFYCKGFGADVVPGAGTTAIATLASSGGTAYASTPLPVTMRAAPTVGAYNSATGANGSWRDSGAVDVAITAVGYPTSATFTGTGVTASSQIGGSWVATAEL